MLASFLPHHPIQLVRRFWIRLVPNLYLPTLIMLSIGRFRCPPNRIVLHNLQNSSLRIVSVSCSFLPLIHVSILCFTFVNELEWSLKWTYIQLLLKLIRCTLGLFAVAWADTVYDKWSMVSTVEVVSRQWSLNVELTVQLLHLVQCVMIRFCPHFIFLFSLPLFQSHDLTSPDRSPDPCHLTGRSPDFLVTWPFPIVLTSYCLAAHCPPYMGTPIVSGPIVSLPIVLPYYCLRPHCTHSPIVRLIRTLSHGSCLSSI